VGGGTLPYTSPLKTYLNFRNSLYLLYKNLPEKGLKGFLFKRMLLDILASCFFMAEGSFRSALMVLKAHMDYYKNIEQLKTKRAEVLKLWGENLNGPVLNKSIVFEFYVKGNKTYNSLFMENIQK
jgi:hypothetical protein